MTHESCVLRLYLVPNNQLQYLSSNDFVFVESNYCNDFGSRVQVPKNHMTLLSKSGLAKPLRLFRVKVKG